MWSIGVTIHQLLTGKVLFEGITEMEYLINIMKKKGTPNWDDSTFFRSSVFLVKMFDRLPKFNGNGIGPDSVCRNDDDDKLMYGFAQLIDALTMLDPTKRPDCSSALNSLAQIRHHFEADMEGHGGV